MSGAEGRVPRVGRAMAQMAGVRIITLAAMAVGLTVLARLISPEEFGIYALAIAFYAVATLIGGLGLRDYAIRHERELDPRTLASGAALSFAVSAALALVFLAVPRLLPEAWVPEVLPTLMVPLALALLVPPLLLQREASLYRRIDFGAPAKADMAGVLCDVGCAIGLALAGFGAVALACGMLAGVLGRGAVLMALSRGGALARPGRGGLRPMLRFGAALTWVRLLPGLVDMALIAALASAGGLAATGYYNRAVKVRDLFKDVVYSGIKPVVLPAFGEMLRGGTPPDRLIVETRRRFAPVAVPAFLGIALLAEPLVLVLFGPDWDGMITAVRILALGAVVAPVTLTAQQTFSALDRIDVYTRIQSVVLALRLAGGLATAFVSLAAFCAVFSMCRCLKAWLILRWEWRELGLVPWHHGAVWRETGLVTAASLAGPVFLLSAADLPPALLLFGAGVLGLTGWALAMRLTGNPLWREATALLSGLRRAA